MQLRILCGVGLIFFAASILPAKSTALDGQLLDAAAAGDVAGVKSLIAAGADVNARDARDPNDKTRLTPLMKAALNGHGEVVKLLIKSGSQVNDVDPYWGSALGMAAAKGHLAVVNELLRAVADPNATNGPDFRMTPLISAVQQCHMEVVKALLAAGADVNARSSQGAAVNLALNSNCKAAVPLLIKARADVNAKDGSGNPALVSALKDPEMVRLLIGAGADVNVRGSGERTIFIRAAGEGSPEVVRLLLEAGADRNAKDKDGATALMTAQSSQRADIIQVLLEGKEDFSNMLEMLRRPEKKQRLSGLWILFQIKDRRPAVEAVLSLLKVEQDAEVRRLANLVLESVVHAARASKDREAAPLLLRFLELADDNLATTVIIALQNLGDRRAIPALRNRFWVEEDPTLIRGALVTLGDARYIWWAEHVRALLGAAALAVFVAGGLFVESRKGLWLLRTAAAGATALATLFLAAIPTFLIVMGLGSSVKTEGLGAAGMVLAAFVGIYCALFAGAGMMIRLRASSPYGNALAIGSVAFLTPVIARFVTHIVASDDSGTAPVLLALVCMAIIFEVGVISGLLDRWRDRFGLLWSERLSWTGFCLLWAALAGPWILPRLFLKPLVSAIAG